MNKVKRFVILNEVERSWQSECIYLLFKRYWNDIEYVLEDNLMISNFENCRERGYTLKYKDKEVSFAENRSSDDIAVYPFKWNDNKNSERDYEKKSKYFKYGEFYKVFEWLLEYLCIEWA